jgi:hypothetical protein
MNGFRAIAFKWHGFLTRVWRSRGSNDGWYVGKPTCRIGLVFPTSDPALMVIPLDHGLEAPCHEQARNRAWLFTC